MRRVLGSFACKEIPMKNVMFLLILSSTPAFAGNIGDPVNPFPGSAPDYYFYDHACNILKKGTYDEEHRCCMYSHYQRKVVCDSQFPNHPKPRPRYCNRREGCDPIGPGRR